MAEKRINKIYKVAPDNFSIKMLYDMFIDFLQEGDNGWELMRNANWPYGAVLKIPNYKKGEYGYVGVMYGQIKGNGKKQVYSVSKNTSYGKWIQQADTLRKYVAWQVMGLDSSRDWHYSQNKIQEYRNKPKTNVIDRYKFNFGSAVFSLLEDVPIGAETITVTTTSNVSGTVPRGVYITIGTDDDTSEEFLTSEASTVHKIDVIDDGVDTSKYLQAYSGRVLKGKCFFYPDNSTVDNIYIGTTSVDADISFSDALSAGSIRKLNIRNYNDGNNDYSFGDMFIQYNGNYAVYIGDEVLTDELGVGTAKIIEKNPTAFFVYYSLDEEMPTHEEYCLELKLSKPANKEHLKGETVQVPTGSRKKLSVTTDNYEPVPSGYYHIREAEAFYSDADVIWFNMFKQYVPEFDWNELMENTRQNPASKRIGWAFTTWAYPSLYTEPPIYPGMGCPAIGSDPKKFQSVSWENNVADKDEDSDDSDDNSNPIYGIPVFEDLGIDTLLSCLCLAIKDKNTPLKDLRCSSGLSLFWKDSRQNLYYSIDNPYDHFFLNKNNGYPCFIVEEKDLSFEHFNKRYPLLINNDQSYPVFHLDGGYYFSNHFGSHNIQYLGDTKGDFDINVAKESIKAQFYLQTKEPKKNLPTRTIIKFNNYLCFGCMFYYPTNTEDNYYLSVVSYTDKIDFETAVEKKYLLPLKSLLKEFKPQTFFPQNTMFKLNDIYAVVIIDHGHQPPSAQWYFDYFAEVLDSLEDFIVADLAHGISIFAPEKKLADADAKEDKKANYIQPFNGIPQVKYTLTYDVTADLTADNIYYWYDYIGAKNANFNGTLADAVKAGYVKKPTAIYYWDKTTANNNLYNVTDIGISSPVSTDSSYLVLIVSKDAFYTLCGGNSYLYLGDSSGDLDETIIKTSLDSACVKWNKKTGRLKTQKHKVIKYNGYITPNKLVYVGKNKTDNYYLSKTTIQNVDIDTAVANGSLIPLADVMSGWTQGQIQKDTVYKVADGEYTTTSVATDYSVNGSSIYYPYMDTAENALNVFVEDSLLVFDVKENTATDDKETSPSPEYVNIFMSKTKHNANMIVNYRDWWDMAQVGFFEPFASKQEYQFPAMAMSSNIGVRPCVHKVAYGGSWYAYPNFLFDYTQANRSFGHSMIGQAASWWDGTTDFLDKHGCSQVQAMTPSGKWRSFHNYAIRSDSYYNYAWNEFVHGYREPEKVDNKYFISTTMASNCTEMYSPPPYGLDVVSYDWNLDNFEQRYNELRTERYGLLPFFIGERTEANNNQNMLGIIPSMYMVSRPVSRYGLYRNPNDHDDLYLIVPNCWENRLWHYPQYGKYLTANKKEMTEDAQEEYYNEMLDKGKNMNYAIHIGKNTVFETLAKYTSQTPPTD